MRKVLIIALPITLLIGCGGDDSSEAPASADGVDGAATSDRSGSLESRGEGSASEEQSSVITVAGAETLDFDHKLLFGCIGDKASISSMTQAPKFMMYFPASMEPGTYELGAYDANADPKYIEGKVVMTFTGAVQRGSGSTYGRFYSEPVMQSRSRENSTSRKPAPCQWDASTEGRLQFHRLGV